MTSTPPERTEAALQPFVSRLAIEWLRDMPNATWREIEGSLVFVDISGFTAMTERLAKKGRVGAEEVSETLSATFASLLAVAMEHGGDLLKWGGDAVLLLFRGDEHARHACAAAHGMRAAMRSLGAIATSAGSVRLRMSVGVHSGVFTCFFGGSLHRELVITGPETTRCVEMEQAAKAGEIVVSPETAAGLPASCLGERKGEGVLLARCPSVDPIEVAPADAGGLDLLSCIPLEQRDQILAGIADPTHRRAVVAFVEVRGVDEMLATHGPGGVADAVVASLAAVQESAARYGVSFHETDLSADGWKILLVAGAPRAIPDEEDSTLRSALEIADGRLPLPVRVGVNAGSVFSGAFGPGFRLCYSIKGDAVNLAARVMGKAALGDVYATGSALDGARGTFLAEPLDAFTVKGKKDPVTAFSVLGVVDASHRDRHARSPMVGRAAERAVLANSLVAAQEGAGPVVEIIGEAGSGKSRLIESARADLGEHLILAGACDPYGRGRAFGLIRSLIAGALGLRPGSDPAEAGMVLTTWAREHLSKRARAWTPLVARVIDVDVAPTAQVERLAETNVAAVTVRAVADVLTAAIPEGGVLLVEDLHWADDASLEALAELGRRDLMRRRAMWVTRRPDAGALIASLGPNLPTTLLELQPLDPREGADLVRSLTHEHPLPVHVVDGIVARAGGNGLFLTELVGTVRASGPDAALPESVEVTIASRVDRLSPKDREVLRAAAVVGQQIDERLVVDALDGVEVPPATWARLGEFVEPEGPHERRFVHALIREVVYESLPYRSRREAHARVGTALERRADDDTARREAADLLVLHFSRARDHSRAWRYGVLAGDRDRDRFANIQSLEAYELALAAARASGAPPASVARVQESLGDVCVRSALYDRAWRAFREARRGSGAEAEPRLYRKQGLAAQRSGRFVAALRSFTAGLAAADRNGDPRERPELILARASTRYWQGDYRACADLCDQAIKEAKVTDQRDALAHAYDLAFLSLSHLRSPERERYRGLAIDLYRASGDLDMVGGALNNEGIDAYFGGEWDRALACYGAAIEAFEEVGSTIWVAVTMNNIAEILSDQGKLEEAELRLLEAIGIYRGAGEPNAEAYAKVNLGRLMARDARFAEAERMLSDALETYARLGNSADRLRAELRFLELRVLSGEGSDALERAADLEPRIVEGADAALIAAGVARMRAYALAEIGSLGEARIAADEAVARAESADSAFERACALQARGEIRAIAGLDARIDLAAARTTFDALGVLSTPDVLNVRGT